MKRTEIAPVKCYAHGDYAGGIELGRVYKERIGGDAIPCILRTAAADKLILDVAREAVSLVRLRSGRATEHLDNLVQRLEKAGVKL